MDPTNASTNQVGGPDQSPQHPTGLRFSFCQIGDFCQVNTMQIIRSRDKLFGKVYFSNPFKNYATTFLACRGLYFGVSKQPHFKGSQFFLSAFFLFLATQLQLKQLLWICWCRNNRFFFSLFRVFKCFVKWNSGFMYLFVFLVIFWHQKELL